MALPGLTPRLPGFAAVPERMLAPVLVTVEAPSTAKLATVPSAGACAWQAELVATTIRPSAARPTPSRREGVELFLFMGLPIAQTEDGRRLVPKLT